MTKTEKQQIVNNLTEVFRGKQWFNGVGVEGVERGYVQDTIIIAYNFYPSLDLKMIKEATQNYNIGYQLVDIEQLKNRNAI